MTLSNGNLNDALANGENPTNISTNHQLDPMISIEEEDQEVRSKKKLKNKRLRTKEDVMDVEDTCSEKHDMQTINLSNNTVMGEDGGITN